MSFLEGIMVKTIVDSIECSDDDNIFYVKTKKIDYMTWKHTKTNHIIKDNVEQYKDVQIYFSGSNHILTLNSEATENMINLLIKYGNKIGCKYYSYKHTIFMVENIIQISVYKDIIIIRFKGGNVYEKKIPGTGAKELAKTLLSIMKM